MDVSDVQMLMRTTCPRGPALRGVIQPLAPLATASTAAYKAFVSYGLGGLD